MMLELRRIRRNVHFFLSSKFADSSRGRTPNVAKLDIKLPGSREKMLKLKDNGGQEGQRWFSPQATL